MYKYIQQDTHVNVFIIQRKASQSARRISPKAEASGDEGMDVDLDNFMTLDSVGDVDGTSIKTM